MISNWFKVQLCLEYTNNEYIIHLINHRVGKIHWIKRKLNNAGLSKWNEGVGNNYHSYPKAHLQYKNPRSEGKTDMMARCFQCGTSQATNAVKHIPEVQLRKESITARARRSGGINSITVSEGIMIREVSCLVQTGWDIGKQYLVTTASGISWCLNELFT